MPEPRALALAAALVLTAGPAAGGLSLPLPFADGMVLQRGSPLAVRGAAEPLAPVRLSFAGRVHETRADAEGRWRVRLASLAAGGPHELVVDSAGERLVLSDVLVGDVWVCSGQSNMEWVVADSMNAPAEIALAGDPQIRHFKVPRSWAEAPTAELAGGAWEPADPEHVGGFTAVGYFFARQLRRHHDVPIGLVNATWGGSRIEPWMRAEALDLDPAGVAEVLAEAERERQAILADLASRLGGLPDRDLGLVDGRAVWAAADLDDSDWLEMPVPSAWETSGFEGMDGVAWYRTRFQLTAEEADAGGRLSLGPIDDSDRTWVNGRQVGGMTGAWSRPRVYELPPEVLVAGENVVAVRVEDSGGGGGLYGDPDALWVDAGAGRRPLAGRWGFRPALVTVNLDDRQREVPTVLYNKMIHPLLAVPVAGVLWYQGESNTWPQDAFVYRDLFRRLIVDWRRGWADAELPFLFVQLASWQPPPVEPGDSHWALLRESQAAALALPATAQVVAIDAGDADDIHPRDKQVIGHRLALAARRVAYGEEVVHSGPVARSHRMEGGSAIVTFDHTGSGLVARHGPLSGFAVAGTDRRFHWARAEIEGPTVVIESPAVPEPVAVRYAWADNPEGANLYNLEGLPAAPFRTDDWPHDDEVEGEAGDDAP